MKYANLHLHSTYSDGIDTPEQLCELAIQKGYKAIAVTDHGTAKGVPAMAEAARAHGIATLSGIEMYADGFDGDFHIVGLDFDPQAPCTKAYTDRQEEIATELTQKRLAYCNEHSLIPPVSWQDILNLFPDVGWFCNEQVFAAMKVLHGAKDQDYWTFMRMFNHLPIPYPTMYTHSEKVISIIREAGGVAILAHPHRQLQYLPDLVRVGLNGVEVCHPDLDEQDEADVRALAKANRLYMSGGTDHSGLLGNCMNRGRPGADGKLAPEKDVSHGASEEEFETIRQRIYG